MSTRKMPEPLTREQEQEIKTRVENGEAMYKVSVSMGLSYPRVWRAAKRLCSGNSQRAETREMDKSWKVWFAREWRQALKALGTSEPEPEWKAHMEQKFLKSSRQ